MALLEKLGLAYVVVDEPQGFRSSTPPVVAATSPLAVVRFHGHNAETYEKPNISAAERFRYLYTEEELKGWVDPDPRPRRTGGPGARADEQLLRRLRCPQRAAAGRAAGGVKAAICLCLPTSGSFGKHAVRFQAQVAHRLSVARW